MELPGSDAWRWLRHLQGQLGEWVLLRSALFGSRLNCFQAGLPERHQPGAFSITANYCIATNHKTKQPWEKPEIEKY
jgi:hypothetical protein